MIDFTLTTTAPADGVAPVTVTGDLDVYTAPQLRDALVGQVNHARYRQVIDLSGVRRIDSTGLAVIVGGRARALMYGGGLRLAVPDRAQNVAHALTVTGLLKVIPVHETAADALAAFETAEITTDTKEAAG